MSNLLELGLELERFSLAVPVSPADWAAGPADAPITLIEYGDFECGDVRRAEPLVQALRQAHGDALRFVFRHFPLTDKHPRAMAAAEAAEAAGAQGAFWAMRELLLPNGRHLTDEDLLFYADTLGLDMPAFSTALADHRYLDRVEEDMAGGALSGISGTPTFFLNGQRFEQDELEALTEAVAVAASAVA